MIDQPKYKIDKFGELERTNGFGEDAEIRFSARIAVMYYLYAYHEMINFCEIKSQLFSLGSDASDQDIAVYTSRAWASAYGMYALLRTVLEATRKIRNVSPEVGWQESLYDTPIKRIIDTANDIIKHPMFNGEDSNAYLPEKGIGIGGEIELNRWTGLDELSTTISLNPEEDLTTVSGYMHYFADRIKSS